MASLDEASDRNKGDHVKNLVAILALMMSASAFAQQAAPEATNTMTVNTGANGTTKKDIDEEITNKKLRASTGSKKNVSVSSTFSYAGGPLTHPTSTERPQLNDGQASADPAKLTGQVAVKWRATDHDNLSLGFGLDFTPSYTSDRRTGETQPARTNASTPYLDCSRVFKSGSVQNVLEAQISKYTAKEDVDDSKLNSEIALSHTMMVGVLAPGLEVGLYSAMVQEIYTETQPRGTLYQVLVDPVLEYAISDKVSFRTVYRALTLNARTENKDTFKAADATESMGLGFAVTRDVYLYPNMQWKWNAISADRTTVGMSANINL